MRYLISVGFRKQMSTSPQWPRAHLTSLIANKVHNLLHLMVHTYKRLSSHAYEMADLSTSI